MWYSRKYPNRLILGSETLVGDAYSFWEISRKNLQVVGDFVWADWDYIGACGPGGPAYVAQSDRPSISGWQLTGAKRSWSWPGCEGRTTDVEIYARASAVELFVNGKSIGRKRLKNKCRVQLRVVYVSRELMVVSYDGSGREIGKDILRTTGKETELRHVLDAFAARIRHLRCGGEFAGGSADRMYPHVRGQGEAVSAPVRASAGGGDHFDVSDSDKQRSLCTDSLDRDHIQPVLRDCDSAVFHSEQLAGRAAHEKFREPRTSVDHVCSLCSASVLIVASVHMITPAISELSSNIQYKYFS